MYHYEPTPEKKSRKENLKILKEAEEQNPLLKALSPFKRKIVVGGVMMTMNKEDDEFCDSKACYCGTPICNYRQPEINFIKRKLAQGKYKNKILVENFLRLFNKGKFDEYYGKIEFLQHERFCTALDLHHQGRQFNLFKWNNYTKKRRENPWKKSLQVTPNEPEGKDHSLEYEMASMVFRDSLCGFDSDNSLAN